MRRALTFTGAAVAAALIAATPAKAVVYGAPDGNAHPEVGGLLAQQAYSDGTWIECTGTLISPTVFLTAAHCDEGVARVRVSFASHYVEGQSTAYSGTYHADPNYNHTASDPQDLAVVVLDKAVKGIAPARLPRAGSLSALSGSQQFTSVGFGAHAVTSGGKGGKQFAYDDVALRRDAGTLNTVTQDVAEDLRCNPRQRQRRHVLRRLRRPELPRRGASETNIIAGTTITGDTPCRSTNVDYRLDTANARAFLGQYVALP